MIKRAGSTLEQANFQSDVLPSASEGDAPAPDSARS